MTLTEICSAVGIPKSKGYSILNTLRHFAFVRKSSHDKTYALGPGLLFLSSKILDNLDLREIVSPVLSELAHETNSTAFLGLISGDHLIVVAKDEGTQEIGVTIRLGHRFPLAWGAHGKAIMAFEQEEHRERILSGSRLYLHGKRTEFEPNRLKRELSECKKKGFAVDPGDMKGGVRAVASPVFGPGEKLIGAIVVVGTFSRNYTQKYGTILASAADNFSMSIGGLRQSVIPKSPFRNQED